MFPGFYIFMSIKFFRVTQISLVNETSGFDTEIEVNCKPVMTSHCVRPCAYTFIKGHKTIIERQYEWEQDDWDIRIGCETFNRQQKIIR